MSSCQIVLRIAPEVYSTSGKEVIQAIKQVKGFTGFRVTFIDSSSGITTTTSYQEPLAAGQESEGTKKKSQGKKRKTTESKPWQSDEQEDVVSAAAVTCGGARPVGVLRFRRQGAQVGRDPARVFGLDPVALVRSPAAAEVPATSLCRDSAMSVD